MRTHVTPALAFTIPGAVAVVTFPVCAEHETDDRNADLHAISGYQNAPAPILFLKEIAGHPATIVTCGDIAP
ncbi:hypothetical protein GCM10009105_10360 [Dokdonella soli]|uniref:Uncharacterized protein n=1 Tax=Dokdonella soli TaxID=529810 RepID=A0ABN1IDX5_9GAMM